MTAVATRLAEGLAPPLDSRLEPPVRTFDAVPRGRLLQPLRTAPAGSVVLLAAPAGYGKSTLLSQFVTQERRPVAWLSLDDRDNDPIVLLSDIAHALGRAVPEDDDPVDRLRVGAGGSTGVVAHSLPRLGSWLSERNEPLVIILDDVHCVGSRDALEVFRALCAHPHGVAGLVLAGRAAPRLPLSRLRADGRLWELTVADLRMTVSEGTAMLRAAGVDVDDAQAAEVVRRTEGWPAAIYLAALMLRRRRGDGAGMPPLGADDANFTAYVREEVLARIGSEDAAFLIGSSILDELRPDLCDAVLQRDDSDTRLRALAAAGLFVMPVDPRGRAYRVHSLFRDLLLAELRRRPGVERDLHRRAGAVYRRDGVWEQAVRHAVAAGDRDLAADLIWQLTPESIGQGRTETVKRWISWLGDADVVSHPQAALARGWVAFEEGDVDLAQHCAAIALAGDAGRTLAGGERVHALGLVLRAALAMHGLARATVDAAQARAALSADDPVRSIAILVMGCGAMLNGETERAARMLGEAERQAAGRLPTLYGLALAQQALLAIEHERWDEADGLMHRAWTFQHTLPIHDFTSQAIVSAVRALTLAHRHEVAPAHVEADRAARILAMRTVVPWLALETRLVLARARVALGDGGSARALLSESRAAGEDGGPPLLRSWFHDLEAALERLGADVPGGVALTSAELRTLRYLPTHLSFAEIGRRLYVTRNTVKTHAISVYRKLDVSSRAEAVERARELGLLGA